jgi:hypothetical protein
MLVPHFCGLTFVPKTWHCISQLLAADDGAAAASAPVDNVALLPPPAQPPAKASGASSGPQRNSRSLLSGSAFIAARQSGSVVAAPVLAQPLGPSVGALGAGDVAACAHGDGADSHMQARKPPMPAPGIRSNAAHARKVRALQRGRVKNLVIHSERPVVYWRPGGCTRQLVVAPGHHPVPLELSRMLYSALGLQRTSSEPHVLHSIACVFVHPPCSLHAIVSCRAAAGAFASRAPLSLLVALAVEQTQRRKTPTVVKQLLVARLVLFSACSEIARHSKRCFISQ